MLIPMDIRFPKMALVAQHIDSPGLEDVPTAIREELARLVWRAGRPGMRVAVTAGSRGVTGIPIILNTVVDELKRLGQSHSSCRRWAATAARRRKARSPY